MERTVRERIKYIKHVRDKHNLTPTEILDICDKNGAYISDKTLCKILKEGSEEAKFQYNSIISVYEALYASFGDEDMTDDVTTLKRMIAERNRQIDNLLLQIEKTHESYEARLVLCDDRKTVYESTINLLKSQLEQSNARLAECEAAIARKDAILERLIESHVPMIGGCCMSTFEPGTEMQRLKDEERKFDIYFENIQAAEAAYQSNLDLSALISFWEALWAGEGVHNLSYKWAFRLIDIYIQVQEYEKALSALHYLDNTPYFVNNNGLYQSYLKKIQKALK